MTGITGTIRSTKMDVAWVTGSYNNWYEASWSETETPGEVYVSIYYDVSGTPTIIPDAAFSGCDLTNQTDPTHGTNSEGFSITPVDLSCLSTATYDKIYLYATLEYSGGTPYLNDWTIAIPENLWLFLVLSPLAGRALKKLDKKKRKKK